MYSVSTIEAKDRRDATFASQAQAMSMIEEFIARVANHRASWEVRYTGPDRAFVFTSEEWEALEAERQQEIRDDPLWYDRVKFWHGHHASKDLYKEKKKQDGQTSFETDSDEEDSDEEESE